MFERLSGQLFFDIETVPNEAMMEGIELVLPEKPVYVPHKTLKDPKKVEERHQAWVIDSALKYDAECAKKRIDHCIAVEKRNKSMALNPLENIVVCICWILSEDMKIIQHGCHSHENEADTIDTFIKIVRELKPRQFVSYNGKAFDVPILRLHAMKYGLQFPEIPVRRWENDTHLDVFEYINDGRRQMTGSMDSLAKFFEIKGKGHIDGSMVYELWKNGQMDEIRDYCINDVRILHEIYCRMFSGVGGKRCISEAV